MKGYFFRNGILLFPLAMIGWTGLPHGAPVRLSLTSGYSSVLRTEKTTVPIKIALEGTKVPLSHERAKANVAIVIDRSGSMAGEKIERARSAAIAAVSLLAGDDIVSVVTYDNAANVVVPATKLIDKDSVIHAIRQITIGGDTGLFAGVSVAAAEVAKFKDPSRANRIILISDGLANVGPSSPLELGQLGASLKKDGVAVTTIGLGLGYNEDLMTQLAQRSDGNHVFAEQASNLDHVFQREFGEILSIVAQNVSLTVNFRNGVRPLRVLGREAEIYGSQVVGKLTQVYGGQEKYLLIEAEIDPAALDTGREFATVELSYWDPLQRRQTRASERRYLNLVDTRSAMEDSVDRPTMSAYYTQLASAATNEAIALADQGRKRDAASVLSSNAQLTRRMARWLKDSFLESQAAQTMSQEDAVMHQPYEKARKEMQYQRHQQSNQQADFNR